MSKDTDFVQVPRALLGALGYIVRNSKHAASSTADQLRQYQMADGVMSSEELMKHAAGLRSLSTWMLENDVDMKCPEDVQDPSETAFLLERLAAEYVK